MDESRNYFVEEIEQNELMGKKWEKVSRKPYYIEQLVQ